VAAPGVLGNDTDPQGDLLTATLVSGPTHGTLTLNADGSFTYAPAADYNGPDQFTYRDSGSTANPDTAIVSLTVTPINDAPVARADAYTTAEDAPLTVAAPGVLGNDSDADADPLTATLVAGPAHGTLALNADGSFIYTPSADYNGPDRFTYKANDGPAGSNIATVALTVTPVNETPIATGDAYGTAKDTALTVAAPGVLANDTDDDSPALTAVLADGPTNGTLTLRPDGSFAYTPNAGFAGVDRFTYRASDGATQSAPATVTIAVGDTATLTTGTRDQGTLGVAPAGGSYPVGTVVTLTPQAARGYQFVGWLVDSAPAGWAATLTITMDRDHAVVARFAAISDFADLPPGTPAYTAVHALAARGIVRGYDDGRFGTGDPLLRAQAAALVTRGLGWDFEDWGTPFGDQGAVDTNLWRNVGALAHYGVARGFGDGTYAPTASVDHAQFLSLITRAMVAHGYWQQQPDDTGRFHGVGDSGHRQDLITYQHYVGGFPDLAERDGAAVWFGPASRGWTARALWAALDQYWIVDRTP